MKLNKPNHLHSSITLKTPWCNAKPAADVFCTRNSTWSERYSQTCKEAAFSAGSYLTQLQDMGETAAVPAIKALQRREGTIKPALDWGRIKPPQTPVIHPQHQKWLAAHTAAVIWKQITDQACEAQTPLPVSLSVVGLSQHWLWFPVNTYTVTPQHLGDTSTSGDNENTHINWMSFKIPYLDIIKPPVANYCRRKTAHWWKRGIFLVRPRSSSSKHRHKPVWLHLLHPLSNTEKALWMSNVSGSLIQAKCKAVSSSSLNTIREVLAECKPPTTALSKVCHGFRVRDKTDWDYLF